MIIRVSLALFLIAVIFIGTLDFTAHLSRFQLAYWWWQWNNSHEKTVLIDDATSKNIISQKELFLKEQASTQDLTPVKQQILDVLNTHNYDWLGFNAALGFASVFLEDPQVQDQLIIIAYDHPDRLIRCKWQARLKTGHDMIIVTSDGQNKTASRFSMRNSDDCANIDETN